MQFDIETTKDMLINYHQNKTAVALIKFKEDKGELPDEHTRSLVLQVEVLDFVLNNLKDEHKEILKSIYISGVSKSLLARNKYMSRSTLVRKKDKAVLELTKFLNIYFEKEQP